MNQQTKLLDYVEHFTKQRDSTPVYSRSLRNAVTQFAGYLGSQPTIADLTPQNVGRWLSAWQNQRSAETLDTYRIRIFSLWRGAFDDWLTKIDAPPVKRGENFKEQIRKLLAA